VDALIGVQLRPHDDLDIVVDMEHVPTVKGVLGGCGYTSQESDLPLSFMVVDPGSYRV